MSVQAAIAAIRRGEPVIVTDDEGRENEGDLIMAAESSTPEKVAFFLRHTSGVICVAITPEKADLLGLPAMVPESQDTHGTAFTVSVDFGCDVTTGISAEDRSRTMRALGAPTSAAGDFVRPGHVFPLRARSGGVLKRAGHTEAAVDLPRLAGLEPAGALCEIVTADKSAMARQRDLESLRRQENLELISIAGLIRHRLAREQLVELVASSVIATRYGEFTCQAWRSLTDGTEHAALVRGDLDEDHPVLTRVHSECLTGDVFHSERCDCGAQLDDALRLIAAEGRGAVVYLRGHEGRGIGLGHKLRAYDLQECGYDTVDANLTLGLPVDAREYGIGAQILLGLGVRHIRLITNNPAKCEGLTGYGIEIVGRVSIPPRPTPANARYLETKRVRMGHLFAAEATVGFE